MFSFSPVGPLSSLTPLLVVFGVAGIKELVEGPTDFVIYIDLP